MSSGLTGIGRGALDRIRALEGDARRRALMLSLAIPGIVVVLVLLVWPLLSMIVGSFRPHEFGVPQPGFTVESYAQVVTSVTYLRVFATTIGIALLVTLICAVLGYPIALHLAAARPAVRSFLYFLIVAPLLINTVVRAYGWLLLLGNAGFVNRMLIELGVISSPVRLARTLVGLVIATVQVFIPFMVLSLVASLQRIDPRILESAELLGAGPWTRFRSIALPLSRQGLIAGSTIVFALMLSAFVTPLVVGGTAIPYLSVAVYTDALVLFNVPRATALAVGLLLIVMAVYVGQSRLVEEEPWRR